MNRQFHNKQTSLAVTDKQAGVDKLLNRSKKTYWSHSQHKNRGKVI